MRKPSPEALGALGFGSLGLVVGLMNASLHHWQPGETARGIIGAISVILGMWFGAVWLSRWWLRRNEPMWMRFRQPLSPSPLVSPPLWQRWAWYGFQGLVFYFAYLLFIEDPEMAKHPESLFPSFMAAMAALALSRAASEGLDWIYSWRRLRAEPLPLGERLGPELVSRARAPASDW